MCISSDFSNITDTLCHSVPTCISLLWLEWFQGHLKRWRSLFHYHCGFVQLRLLVWKDIIVSADKTSWRVMPEFQSIILSRHLAFSNMSHNASVSAWSSSDLALFLQKARKWTHKHLEAARVKISENVTMEDLLGQEYIPLDGDPGMGHPWSILI